MIERELDFEFSKPLTRLTDLTRPIVGGDLLNYFHLQPDLTAWCLVNAGTGEKSNSRETGSNPSTKVDTLVPWDEIAEKLA